MLRTFAAVLLATSLAAGAALAAEPVNPAGSPPSAAANANAATMPTHRAKHVKHARKHERKHLAMTKHRSVKAAHHFKRGKTHKSHVAKTVKRTKLSKSGRPAGVKTAKLPVVHSTN